MRQFLILMLLANILRGQNMRWFLDKPFTRADSVAIIKNNIKSVSVFGLNSDSLYQSPRKINFYFSNKKIDSAVCTNCFIDYRIVEKITKNKIVETVTMKPSTPKSLNIVIRRTHYLDRTSQVIRTENKVIEGMKVYGLESSDVYYKYKDGLLYEAYSCDSGKKSLKNQCDTIRCKYEFVKHP